MWIISYMLTKTGEAYAKARIVDISRMPTITHNWLMIVKSKPSSMGESDQVSHNRSTNDDTWTSLRT